MTRRLYRSKTDKMLAGVCGGLAEYFNIDPVLVRIGFVLLAITTGTAILAYIILWIVAPKEPFSAVADQPMSEPVAAAQPVQDDADAKQRRTMIAGIAIIAIGALFLAENFLPWFSFGRYWPLILVGIGAGVLYHAFKSKQEATA